HLDRRRPLVLSVGLAMVLSLATVLPSAAAPSSSLNTESFSGGGSSGNSEDCSQGGSLPTWTYAVSGTAAGPYEGTFTETGSQSTAALFTITSGATTIRGT